MINNIDYITKNINANSHTKPLNKKNINQHFNENKTSKLVVLKLDDLDVTILNLLKESKCGMLFLNENFTVVDNSRKNKTQKISLLINGYKQLIAAENIIRIEAYGNYTYVFLKDIAKPVLTSRTLKYHSLFLSNITFLRSHKKHLINQKYISKLNKDNSICLNDGTSIPIARRRLKKVKETMKRHIE